MLQDILSSGITTVTDPSPIDPIKLVADSLGDVFRAESAASTRFIYDFSHSRSLLVDELRVRRVFVNLIENARQAMKSAGTISISTRDGSLADGGPAVMVTIHNTGSFIPIEDRERIFEPYFSKGKKGGTGLGLVVARRVVAAHAGSIRCDSSEGGGTSFSILLPATEANVGPIGDCALWESAEDVRRFYLEKLEG
jgi:signal transduction histidine kinase